MVKERRKKKQEKWKGQKVNYKTVFPCMLTQSATPLHTPQSRIVSNAWGRKKSLEESRKIKKWNRTDVISRGSQVQVENNSKHCVPKKIVPREFETKMQQKNRTQTWENIQKSRSSWSSRHVQMKHTHTSEKERHNKRLNKYSPQADFSHQSTCTAKTHAHTSKKNKRRRQKERNTQKIASLSLHKINKRWRTNISKSQFHDFRKPSLDKSRFPENDRPEAAADSQKHERLNS